MARFPKKEAEIVALADRLWRGLSGNLSIYPNPPVHPILIRIKSMIYSAHRNDFIAAQAAAEESTTAKDDALDDLADAMKSDIRYAENTIDFDDDKLKLIGWSGRRERTPLAPPARRDCWKHRNKVKAGYSRTGRHLSMVVLSQLTR